MKDYTTYIFDLDGTLTDTTAVWLQILRDCLKYCGVEAPDDRTIARHTHDWKEMLKLGLPEDKLETFVAHAHMLANERLPQASLNVGAQEMLDRLKNSGKRVAIFSTMDRAIFEPAMGHHNLFALAESAVAGTDVEQRKPHPAGIFKVLEDLQIPKDDYDKVVYIGDKDTDIQAANNAGVDGVLYYPIAHQLVYDLKELKAHKPAAVISDWSEVLATETSPAEL